MRLRVHPVQERGVVTAWAADRVRRPDSRVDGTSSRSWDLLSSAIVYRGAPRAVTSLWLSSRIDVDAKARFRVEFRRLHEDQAQSRLLDPFFTIVVQDGIGREDARRSPVSS